MPLICLKFVLPISKYGDAHKKMIACKCMHDYSAGKETSNLVKSSKLRKNQKVILRKITLTVPDRSTPFIMG